MLDVANVFGQDLGGTATAVGNMIKAGLAKDAGEALDLLTVGFQKGADKGGDLLDTFAQSSVNLKQFGFTGKSAMGVLVQALEAGAPNADAFTGALEELIGNASDGIETFDKLGLGGKRFADQLAGGGPGAAKALDQLLDRIRAIESPAERSAVLVELFGEEATALQSALLAVDPSSAAQKLGSFAGATKQVGETIRSGPSYEIQRFTRALKQGFVNFLGDKVLPVIMQVGQFFNAHLLPPIRAVASVVALTSLWRAGRATVNWLRDMGAWLIPIAIAVGGLALSMSLGAIAAGANALAIGAVTVAMRIARGITLAFAGAQAVLNAVMRANPIVLVVTLIAALVAALVVAYRRSETFRAAAKDKVVVATDPPQATKYTAEQ